MLQSESIALFIKLTIKSIVGPENGAKNRFCLYYIKISQTYLCDFSPLPCISFPHLLVELRIEYLSVNHSASKAPDRLTNIIRE